MGSRVCHKISPVMLQVYGTFTSPYVRRVRIVAHELGLTCDLVDTAGDAGQAALRERSPIWKVPAAELDGALVFDSHVIGELLLQRHGPGPLRPLAVDDIEGRNAISVIDGALDSLINCFYLEREGHGSEVPYLHKQRQRATSALAWIEQRLGEDGSLGGGGFGLPEIGLGTALAWMHFRRTFPVAEHPRLLAALEIYEKRPSFAATREFTNF